MLYQQIMSYFKSIKDKKGEVMNIKEKVFKYMGKHPDADTNKLRKAFPGVNKKSLWNYSGQWRKENGIQPAKPKSSIRQKVFSYFDANPSATLKNLREVFPDANKVSISNYRYQWKKLQPDSSNQKRAKSIKEQVFSHIEMNPEIAYCELCESLPDINPSSISAYHSIWKKTNDYKGPKSKIRKRKAKQSVSLTYPMNPGSGEVVQTTIMKDLVDALKATIEAQKGTIETLMYQNDILKKQQSSMLFDISEMSQDELKNIKDIVGIFVKGLKKK